MIKFENLKIRSLEKNLAAAKKNKDTISFAIGWVGLDKIIFLEKEINRLEEELPVLAAKAVLANAGHADFYKRLKEKAEMEREKAFYDAALEGLEPMMNEALEYERKMREMEESLENERELQRELQAEDDRLMGL